MWRLRFTSGAMLLAGATFRGSGTACLGDNNNSGEDDACDDLFIIPAVSTWGVLILTLFVLATGTILIRRPVSIVKRASLQE